MDVANYTRTITVSASPARVYEALTGGFEHWWTVPDRPVGAVGDRVRVTFPPQKSFWTFEAADLQPDRRVEMKCVEAHHLHDGQPAASEQEWLGSRMIWRIEADGAKTRIRFEHIGLNPDLACYDVCEAGWNHFFVDSLKAYLDTGAGRPHR